MCQEKTFAVNFVGFNARVKPVVRDCIVKQCKSVCDLIFTYLVVAGVRKVCFIISVVEILVKEKKLPIIALQFAIVNFVELDCMFVFHHLIRGCSFVLFVQVNE